MFKKKKSKKQILEDDTLILTDDDIADDSKIDIVSESNEAVKALDVEVEQAEDETAQEEKNELAEVANECMKGSEGELLDSEKETIVTDNPVSELETSISISPELLDGKGIDVVKVEQENKLAEGGNLEIKTTISTKNYDETVVKLINEVKIFSDDDDSLGINGKRKIWPVLLIILLLLISLGGMYYYFYIYETNDIESKKKKEPNEPTVRVTYRYEENDEGIVFYGNDEVIDTYECDNCKVYSLGSYDYFSTNPTLLAIQQDNKIFLYDYVLQQVVSDKYSQFKNLKNGDDTVAFIVTNSDGMSGIIDIKGNVIVPLEYDEIGYSKGNGDVSDYSYQKNMITASKGGYWGVINFNGEQVIPFEYEDIYYNGYNSIAVYVEGLWYLNDLSNNRLIEQGYEMIIPINSYVFASANNVFYVLNYHGEPIINKAVPTYLNTFRSRENVVTPSFTILEEGTVVRIYIMSSDKTYDEYKFNTVNGELTEIIQ